MFLKLLFIFLIVADFGKCYESKQNIFPLITNRIESTKNELCRMHSRMYNEHLRNLTFWAHEMWDATGKYYTGILRGNSYEIGSWDQCLTIEGPFKTQYCFATVGIHFPKPTALPDILPLHPSPYENVLTRIYNTGDVTMAIRHQVNVGICVPASCTPHDIETFLNDYVKQFENGFEDQNVTYTVKVPAMFCQNQYNGKRFDYLDITFCLVVFVLIMVILSSTIYDVQEFEKVQYKQQDKNEILFKRVFLAFSLKRNWNQLIKSTDLNPDLNPLHGIKTFILLFSVAMHRLYVTVLTDNILNYNFVEKFLNSFIAVFLVHGDLCTDSLFIISGLLHTYNFLLNHSENKAINPFVMICKTYFRLTPTLGFVVFFYATILDHIGSGPLWPFVVSREVIDCRENGWLNLLYLQNYIHSEHMCFHSSWFVACYFQFYIMGTIVLMIFKRNKQVALKISVILCLISIMVPFGVIAFYSRPPMMLFYRDLIQNVKSHIDFRNVYIKPHVRALSYAIGMFAGYVYYKLKNTRRLLSKMQYYIFTTISLIIAIVSIASGTIYYNRYRTYNRLEAGIFGVLHRLAWNIGTLGFIISITFSPSNIFKSTFSSPIFILLGKILHSAYLVHWIFLIQSEGVVVTSKYLGVFGMIKVIISDIVLAFAGGLLLYLGVEQPFKIIFDKLTLSLTLQKKRV